MLLYLTFKKIYEYSEIEIVWRGEATGRHIPGKDLPLFIHGFVSYKSDHGVDFGGKLKVIADRLSQSVLPAQSNHV